MPPLSLPPCHVGMLGMTLPPCCQVLGPFESGIIVVAMILVPPLFYAALYHPTILHVTPHTTPTPRVNVKW